MPDLVRDLLDVGLSGLLILVLIGGFREWWVYGPAHKRTVAELHQRLKDLGADRDFWRTAALRGTKIAEKAVESAAARDE